MGHWEGTGRKEVLKAPTEESGRTGEKRWVWSRQLVKPNEQVWEAEACLEAFRGHWAVAEAGSESGPPRKQDFSRLGFGSSYSFLPGLSPEAWVKGNERKKRGVGVGVGGGSFGIGGGGRSHRIVSTR